MSHLQCCSWSALQAPERTHCSVWRVPHTTERPFVVYGGSYAAEEPRASCPDVSGGREAVLSQPLRLLVEDDHQRDTPRRRGPTQHPDAGSIPINAQEQTWTREAAALEAAGWAREVRGPKKLRIWCEDAADPQKFWAGEEVAYARLQGKTIARGA